MRNLLIAERVLLLSLTRVSPPMPFSQSAERHAILRPATAIAPSNWLGWNGRNPGFPKREKSFRMRVIEFMKFTATLYAMMICATTIFAVLLAFQGPLLAADDLTKAEESTGATDVGALLEKGRAAGSLPEGMIVRIAACLGAADAKPAGESAVDELKETWEFTANEVHRVVAKSNKDQTTYRRVESHAFDSKDICKDLLDGKAIEIESGKGEGPEVGLVGTRYHLGSRSIEVVWKGKTILHLYESRAAGLKLYRESDARAFGALYERLASQTHALIKP